MGKSYESSARFVRLIMLRATARTGVTRPTNETPTLVDW